MAAYTSKLDAVPVLEEIQGLKPPRPMDAADRLENLSIGFGKGVESQLEGIKQLVTNPIDAFTALYEMGKYAVQNPRAAASGVLDYVKQGTTGGPLAMGQFVGENIGPGMFRRRPTMQELDAYHGTPHRFEPEEGSPLGRFQPEKIGTGEGAQAYGHGLYFAENPDVARLYIKTPKNTVWSDQANVKSSAYRDSQAEILKIERELRQKHGSNIPKDEISAFMYAEENADKFDAKLMERIRAARQAEEKAYKDFTLGSLYSVDIPDKMIDRMLDWDKPLSEQPEAVRKLLPSIEDAERIMEETNRLGLAAFLEKGRNGPANKAYKKNYTSRESRLANLVIRLNDPKIPNWLVTGKELYEEMGLGSPKRASAFFVKHGIPGIRYLDGQSRKAGEGTRNFVVFPGEEQNLRILERQ